MWYDAPSELAGRHKGVFDVNMGVNKGRQKVLILSIHNFFRTEMVLSGRDRCNETPLQGDIYISDFTSMHAK